MADSRNQGKSDKDTGGGLFGLLSGAFKGKKEERISLGAGTGKAGDRFVATKTQPALGAKPAANRTNPLAKQATLPLSPEEKAKQAEERRYLITAYEANPRLIPEFQNAPYMYKLISQERDYTQEVLNEMLARRRTMAQMAGPSEELPPELVALDHEIQNHRNELARLFKLIKRVAGVQRSGTGGTDFLDPMRNGS